MKSNKAVDLEQQGLLLPQGIIDSIPFGVLVTDINLHLVQINKWVTLNAKLLPEVVIGTPLGEVFPELASRNLIEAYHLVLHGGMPITLSNRIHRYFFKARSRNPDLSEMPQTATITPIYSENQLIGTITFINDVSERVNIENVLQKEVSKLGALHEIDYAVSTLDMNQCLEVIVQRTQVLFNCERVVLSLFEEGELRVASSNLNEGSNPTASTLAAWAAINSQSRLAFTAREDEAQKLEYQMAAPLIASRDCIGVLNVQTSRVDDFSQSDLELLEAIAARAAVAIQNARLHTSEREQREFAEAIREISLTMASELDLEVVLDAILKSIGRVVHFDAACILLQEEEHLSVKRYLGFDIENIPEPGKWLESYFEGSNLIQGMKDLHLPQSLFKEGQESRDSIFDIDPRFSNFAGSPIVIRGRQIGFLLLGKTETQAYPKKSLDHLAAFASAAAIALENARLYNEQQRLAVTDGLTGLTNRRRFDAEMKKEIEKVARYKRPTSLIMLDIDNFKHYNDHYGHQAGDEILKLLAHQLMQSMRDVDIVARYGGEEFALILPEVGPEAAYQVAERIRTGVEGLSHTGNHWNLQGNTGKVTISLGVAGAPCHAHSPAELIHAADSALYKAKHNGKNQTVLSDLSQEIYQTSQTKPYGN